MITDSLNIDELESIAAVNLDIAKKAKELQSLVNRGHPGFRVYIQREGGKKGSWTKSTDLVPASDLSSLSGVEQLETILGERKEPMKKRTLFARLRERGGAMTLDTMTSYLSRYPQFVNRGHGLWSLDKK